MYCFPYSILCFLSFNLGFFQFLSFFHPCRGKARVKNDKEWRVVLQVKVIHAFKKLEEINRDLIELSKLSDRIAEDRDYSGFLKDSFQTEIQKLKANREEIFNIKVNQPQFAKSSKSTNPKEEGQKLYQENETSFRDEQTIAQNESNTKKETKKKPERPVYKY